MAIAHKILVAAYWILRTGQTYRELKGHRDLGDAARAGGYDALARMRSAITGPSADDSATGRPRAVCSSSPW
jgi:hypothetical protein